jgi:branched-chain amino acid transport system ATP-binding protein
MQSALIEIRNLYKQFGGFTALSNVNFEVYQGERLGLIGPNGSGKTTLINCIAGALRQSRGVIVYKGTDVTSLPAHQRTRMGIVRSFQIPRPFSSMTVIDNICVPLEYVKHHGLAAARSDVRAEGMTILKEFGLVEKADVLSSQLTQVDLRKMELARAMAVKPALLMSDEAMAGLSSSEVDEVLSILFRVSERGITIIMIEHIMRAVMRFSERVICLDAGQIIAEAPPEEIVKSPEVRRAYLGT